MMAVSGDYLLEWSDFRDNLASTAEALRHDNVFTDITLISEDLQDFQVHRVVLSSCSNLLRDILFKLPGNYPSLFFKGIQGREMKAILEFIYQGKTSVSQDKLDAFMEASETLKLKGLAGETLVPEESY